MKKLSYLYLLPICLLGLFSHPLSAQEKENLKIRINRDTTICQGTSLKLRAEVFNAVGAAHLKWKGLDLEKRNVQEVKPQKSTRYTVEVSDESGAVATASVFVKVLEKPKPAIDGAQNICPGVNAQLDAGNFMAYRWSTGATSRTIKLTDDGEFSVTVTDENGCRGEANVKIGEYDFKDPKIEGLRGLCGGLTTTLDAGEYASYKWNTGATTQAIEVKDDGLYTVTVTDKNGCVTKASAKVREAPGAFPWIELVAKSARQDDIRNRDHKHNHDQAGIGKRVDKPVSFVMCPGETIQLRVDGDDHFERHEWNTGSRNQTIKVSEPGTYSVLVENHQGCLGKTSVDVRLASTPQVEAGADRKLKRGQSVELSASGASHYNWESDPTLSCLDCPNPTASPLKTTTYWVTGEDENGCPARDGVTVKVRGK